MAKLCGQDEKKQAEVRNAGCRQTLPGNAARAGEPRDLAF
jgi:hypothetical protein